MFGALYIDWIWDPVAFTIPGLGLEVRYYGLMWALSTYIAAISADSYFKREKLPMQLSETAFFYGIIGIIVGSRLGHCLFYEPEYFLRNPMQIIFGMRDGGMASHGAAMGMIVGLWLFSRRSKLPLIWSMDRVVMPLTISAAIVRMGNLFNSEIFGMATDRAWGFRFLRSGTWLREVAPMASHPTQIYEAVGYFISFVVVSVMYYKYDVARQKPGVLAGVGLMLLGFTRFIVEFWKLNQVAFEQGMSLTMGQWLSIPFILIGIAFVKFGLDGRFAKPDVKEIEKALKARRK
ncbi:MAG: prolipoprotein diacylglyceryl transferase [Rikenellaceae bacterium]